MTDNSSSRHRVKLLLSYDGTAYQGWQSQPDERPTVQKTVEKALQIIFGSQERIKCSASSRTDTGVHAFGQVAHFDAPKDPSTLKDLCYSLQAVLPPDIVAKQAWLASPKFESTRNVESKEYRYVIFNSKRQSALKRNYSYWVRDPLDIKYLNECSLYLLGLHDFTSFQNSGFTTKTTQRELFTAEWSRTGSIVSFDVKGSGFLKQMVRIIVGTLINMQSQGTDPKHILNILKAKDRKVAGFTAPPQGLYLMRINYADVLDNKCRKL